MTALPTRASGAPAPPDAAHAVQVLDLLERAYPDAKCALDFQTPFQLLIATILAAQAQDKHINTVTPGLFAKYPRVHDWAEAPLEQLERDLKPTGFFRNKAKAVKSCCLALLERHGGEVPQTMEELVALPGVGRKTANVILGNAFGHPDRVACDTHVLRLSLRLGFTIHEEPERVERDLEALWPAERRTRACHLLQFHGRKVCVARRPKCDVCPVNHLCPSAFRAGEGLDDAEPAGRKRRPRMSEAKSQKKRKKKQKKRRAGAS